MKNITISLIGLGYVGLPIALAFDHKTKVIGFDSNQEKINAYRQGIDPTKEMGDEKIKRANIHFTANAEDLKQANFHIVAVPTPITSKHKPDLQALVSASETVGKILKENDTVVFESTVYPGVTEDVCIPILEANSKLKCGRDFNVGYSPERINPGDKIHTVETIVKVVSGNNEAALDLIAKVYSEIINVGVYRAPSIKVAEAAKVVENTQRDINIALMNELSGIFRTLEIDTYEVLAAAKTKWNFLDFEPGLVGGHCISIDPYYLTYRAQQVGCKPELILAGRKVNDCMGRNIAEMTIKTMLKHDVNPKDAQVAILGMTFKENTSDIRNSKVFDIYEELKEYGVIAQVVDPHANAEEVKDIYNITLCELESLAPVDVIILAVAHQAFISLDPTVLKGLYKNDQRILIDLKSVINTREDYIYSSL